MEKASAVATIHKAAQARDQFGDAAVIIVLSHAYFPASRWLRQIGLADRF